MFFLFAFIQLIDAKYRDYAANNLHCLRGKLRRFTFVLCFHYSRSKEPGGEPMVREHVSVIDQGACTPIRNVYLGSCLSASCFLSIGQTLGFMTSHVGVDQIDCEKSCLVPDRNRAPSSGGCVVNGLTATA